MSFTLIDFLSIFIFVVALVGFGFWFYKNQIERERRIYAIERERKIYANALSEAAGAHPVVRQKPRVPSDIAIAFPMRVAVVVGKGYSLKFNRLFTYGRFMGWACVVVDGDGNKICIESGKTRADAFFEAFQKAGLRCPR